MDITVLPAKSEELHGILVPGNGSQDDSGDEVDDFDDAAPDSSRNSKFVNAKNLKNLRSLRQEQLSRFSSSCPSLDVGYRSSFYTNLLDVTQEEDEDTVAAATEGDDLSTTGLTSHYSFCNEDTAEKLSEPTDIDMAAIVKVRKGSLEEALRSHSLMESTSREDLKNPAARDEGRNKVKRSGSLIKRISSAVDGTKASGKTALTHRASISESGQRVPVPRKEAKEKTGVGILRRSSFMSPAANVPVANILATKIFGLDKSRSVSTPSINADSEMCLTGNVVEQKIKAEAQNRGPSTVKRRSSLFAHFSLFTGHHHNDSGSRKKPDGGNRLSAALSLLSGHHHKDKDGSIDGKKVMHLYASVPVNDASACGACGRTTEGKQVLQCTNCLLLVHDSCRTASGIPCLKQKAGQKAHSLIQPIRHVSSMPPSYSKGAGGSVTLPGRRGSLSSNALQDMPSITLTPDGSSGRLDGCSGAADALGSSCTLGASSADSLTEDASSEDFEPDVELLPIKPEPESWSETVDKRVIKKLNAKYIQRQDCIWEFINSERYYVHALKTAETVFARGMAKHCSFSRDIIDRLFPGLENLVEMHVGFLERLLQRQNERADRSVDVVGDIILEQFGGYLGMRIKSTYGKFVSRQREAEECYNDLLRADRKFEAFVRRCSESPNTGNCTMRAVMGFIAQRMKKYRAQLDQLVKNTKESRDRFDKENLTKASDCVKRIMEYIEDTVEQRKRELRLIDIYTRTDVRSVAAHKGSKAFRKSDLLAKGRKLLHEGVLSCRNSREKEADVLFLLLTDAIVFLQECNRKYVFFSPDSKSVVIPLRDVVIREKGNSKDNRTFYVSRRCTPNGDSDRSDSIVELSCKTPAERREWVERLSKATHECESPNGEDAAEDDDITDSPSSAAVEQLAKVNEVIESLQVKDDEVNALGSERLQMSRDLLVEYGRIDETAVFSEATSSKYSEDNEFSQAVDLLRAAHTEVLRLASSYLAYPFAVSPAAVSSGWSAERMLPASQVVANSQHRASIAASSLLPGSPVGHESFFGSFGRQKRLGRSAEDVRMTGRSSVDSDSEGATSSMPRPSSAARPQWTKKWVKDGGQNEGHNEQPSAAKTRQQHRRRCRTGRATSLVASVTRSISLRDGKKTASALQLAVPGFRQSQPWSAADIAASAAAPAHQPSAVSQAESGQLHASAAHLSEYLQAVLLITNNQDSTINRYKQLTTEHNVRIRELNQDLEKMIAEKNAFPHNKKLEEIRSLSEQIAGERQRWQAEKSAAQQHNEDERLRLEQLMHDQEAQREALRKEREELSLLRSAFFQQAQEPAVSLPPASRAAAPNRCATGKTDSLHAVGRSSSADTKVPFAGMSGDSASAACGSGSAEHSVTRWGSPLLQRRAAKASKSTGQSVPEPSTVVKMAAEAGAVGVVHSSRDKKRPQSKR